MPIKPVVQYTGNALVSANYRDVPQRADIYGVLNHPRLGQCPWVITSQVLSFDEKTGRIETKNTIYEKVENNA